MIPGDTVITGNDEKNKNKTSEIENNGNNDGDNDNNSVTTVLLWDGSTEGYLNSSFIISESNFLDINKSLRAATVFSKNATDTANNKSNIKCLLDLKNDVEKEGTLPGCLYRSEERRVGKEC